MIRDLVLLLAFVSLPAIPGQQPLGGFGEVHAPIAPDGIAAPARPAGATAAHPGLPSLATAYTQTYAWPLGRHLHDGLLIVNYVDHDPTSGILDYSGGAHAYDGHTGTDNALYNFRLMDRGCPIRAAASGTVAFIQTGSPYDRHCDFNWPDDGNWIWIDGGDGSYHEYLHLRRNSMTVKLGDVVQTGQMLGLVGSSGYSTFPHLHFEAGAYDGPAGAYQPRDPYHGIDNALPSLWNVQPAYEGTDPFWISDAGIYTESEVGGAPWDIQYCDIVNPLPEPLTLGITENKICMRFQYQSDANDTVTIVVRKPDGSVYGNFDFNTTAAVNFDWFWSWFYFGPYVTAADYGTWREQVYRKNGPLISDHPVTVAATTTWGPRFWPHAGRSFAINGAVQRDTLREFPLGPAVTYSLLNAPAYVTLADSIVSVAATSTQTYRSSYFQVVMTDGAARRDTAFYHLVDMSKPLDPLPAAVAMSPPHPTALALVASPQPFRDGVTLAFALPQAGDVTLAVHDLAGRRVRTIARGTLAAGEHLERWDGRDDAGRALPSGLYFARLVTPGGAISRTLVRR